MTSSTLPPENAAERRRTAPVTDVLIVDDEDDIRELIEMSLLRMGLGAEGAGTVAEARALLASRRYRLCLTDMRLPDGDGLELVEYIQQAHPGLPVAVITAFASVDTAIRALKLGAFDFVTKPIEFKVLRELIQHALKLEPESAPSAAAAESGRELIGASPAFVELCAQAEKLARTQAPVFILGESGTGKEVIARFIHQRSTRAAGPFVPVNCGAISPELMESEFFGHRKGSFTGASSDREGLFQAARGGTLFLDEIGELPLAMQVKLLRALQERAVRAVGGREEEAVDVRILSASHQDLARLVEQGRFRQDLFFRINVINLRLPPLRERSADIELLAAHILQRLGEREQRRMPVLSPAALAALQAYAFPGNVRELENLLERACALCESSTISVDDLGLEPSSVQFSVSSSVSSSVPSSVPLFAPVPTSPAAIVSSPILPATAPGEAEITAAALALGLSPRQLRYRLRKWNIL
ncbi:MAG: sigma-54 dependent transcriptional regulator [Thauera sp.]|nr:sigma-54 dependent transcriptional regulator [Thauera sp.]